MSPFPIEAIDEVILQIDEALGTSDAPKTPMRGWIKKAKAADIRVFLGGLKWHLEHVKSVLTDKEHQNMLREYGDPEQIVLREKKAEGGAE